jgi:hypothetical protein
VVSSRMLPSLVTAAQLYYPKAACGDSPFVVGSVRLDPRRTAAARRGGPERQRGDSEQAPLSPQRASWLALNSMGDHHGAAANTARRELWNKGKIVGQEVPFKLKDIWALRVRLQMEHRVRELALFNLGIDSKLRGCDLVRDVCHGDQMATRAIVMQRKTQRITLATRGALQAWIKQAELRARPCHFKRRLPLPRDQSAPTTHASG